MSFPSEQFSTLRAQRSNLRQQARRRYSNHAPTNSVHDKARSGNSSRMSGRRAPERHGKLMFHQSVVAAMDRHQCALKPGGRTGDSDIPPDEVCGVPLWMSRDQYEYWKHTEPALAIVPGRGSSFCLYIPTGFRFMIRSRVFIGSGRAEIKAQTNN